MALKTLKNYRKKDFLTIVQIEQYENHREAENQSISDEQSRQSGRI
jgi:hypothetical protein